MEFKDELKKYTERLENIKDTLQTEEATKMSLIVPFFQLLLRKIQTGAYLIIRFIRCIQTEMELYGLELTRRVSLTMAKAYLNSK